MRLTSAVNEIGHSTACAYSNKLRGEEREGECVISEAEKQSEPSEKAEKLNEHADKSSEKVSEKGNEKVSEKAAQVI